MAQISIDNVALSEGDSGTTSFVFTISSDTVSSREMTVAVDTTDLIEAVAGTDYVTVVSQGATIAAGSTSTTFIIDINGDRTVEADETFSVSLSDARFNGSTDPSRVTLGDGIGEGTILNDDFASISINDVAMLEGDSGATSFAFTISSDLAASKELSVSVTAIDLDDAIGGPDLIEVIAQTASIAAGDTSTTVIVDVIGDRLVELDEVFRVELSDARFDGATDDTRVLIADNVGRGTIVNDDMAIVTIDDVAAIEGDTGTTNLVFTVSTDAAASLDMSLTVRTAGGFEAVVNADYFGIPDQDLVIAAGETSATITIEAIGDSLVENDETFVVLLRDALFNGKADATRISIEDNTGVGTITNDDSAAISIEDVTAIEGDDGITQFVFTIRQDALASLDTSVVVNTSDISEAIAQTDYIPIANQVVTIAAGTRTATLSVGVIGEALVEATESFRVDLSDARFGDTADSTRITIGVATGIATILNDDAGSFLIDDLVVNEGDGTASLTVSIASPIDVDTTLGFTLDQNDDIQNLDSQITFRAGASQAQSLRFTIQDDILVEGSETYIGFFELMSRSDGRDVVATVATSIEILDNDKATLSISEVTVDEAVGTTTITIGIDAPFDIDATFDLTSPIQSDILFIDASTTFAAGSTEPQTITVAINDDQIVELDETIDIGVVAATDLGTRDVDTSDVGTIEIIENDSAVFTVENLEVFEGGGAVQFVVSVDKAIDIDTTLAITLAPTEDLSIITPTITFPGGSRQSQAFTIDVVDDDIEELTEQVGSLVSIETDLGSRVVSAPEPTVFTIRDDDTPDFLRQINENILTSTVPILVPTTGSGGGGGSAGAGSSAGGAAAGANATAPNQAPADSGSGGDAATDSAAAEEAVGTESIASTGQANQDSGTTSAQGGLQSFANSESNADLESSDANQSKNVSSDSEFASDAGELYFHVVLPNGKLGKKYELDMDLLDEASLFDRFRGLPTDVYRVLYREPGSDSVQQLFEIYVVEGKIETIAHLRDAQIERVDPSHDVEQPAPEADGATLDAEKSDASADPDLGRVGRFAGSLMAASLALSNNSSRPWKNRLLDSTTARRLPRMDAVSRILRRLRGSL